MVHTVLGGGDGAGATGNYQDGLSFNRWDYNEMSADESGAAYRAAVALWVMVLPRPLSIIC